MRKYGVDIYRSSITTVENIVDISEFKISLFIKLNN
jgi:hypothetical protein